MPPYASGHLFGPFQSLSSDFITQKKSITNCYLNLAYIFNYGKNVGYKSEWIRVHSNKIIPYQDVIKSRIYNDRPILWPILLVIVMIKDRGKKQSELLILINTVY